MYFDKSLSDNLNKLKQIPTLPHILLELIKACNAEDVSPRQLSGIVEKDPALTAQMLQLVNSAYYSKSSRIKHVEGAVVFLGTHAVKNLAIASSVHEVFRKIKPAAGFNLKHFWWHSLMCAVLAKAIARKQRFKDPEEAFLFGMLHDIGKIILWVNFPVQYAELLEKRKDQPDLILAGETELGANHAEIGAWMLKKWNFQHAIADAVLCHHHSQFSMLNAPPLAQCVYAANLLSSDYAQKYSDGLSAAEKLFGFKQETVEVLLHRTEDELTTIAESLNIEIEPFKADHFKYSDQDREKEKSLTLELQDQLLLQSTVQNLLAAADEEAVWRETAQGLQIFLGFTAILFFAFDPEINGLRGVSLPEAKQSHRIGDMIISMQAEESLLVACLQTRKIMNSFSRTDSDSLADCDRPILQILQMEAMACVPMTAHGEAKGVIVLGLDQKAFSDMESQQNLLQMLARQSAVAIGAHRPASFPAKQYHAAHSDDYQAGGREAKSGRPPGLFRKFFRNR